MTTAVTYPYQCHIGVMRLVICIAISAFSAILPVSSFKSSSYIPYISKSNKLHQSCFPQKLYKDVGIPNRISSLPYNHNKWKHPKDKKGQTALLFSAEVISDGEDTGEVGKNSGGTQSIPSATFNLIKAAVGSGVLALPSGVAAIGDVPRALLSSSSLVVLLGAISAYSFFMIGRICDSEGESSTLSELWEKEVGAKSSWLISLCCFVTPFGAALTYSIILGDTFSSLAKSANLPSLVSNRPTSILGITLLALYPLCSLKSLASLSPFSLIGVSGVLATSVFMLIRLISCSYVPGSPFLASMSPNLCPSFDQIGLKPLLQTPSTLILGSMAATAYLVHFSGPDFHKNLKNNTLKRYGILTIAGFLGTALLNIAFMSFGFLTFGGNCSGNILNNYSIKDVGAILCRFFIGVSLIGSYPLLFSSMRNEFVNFIYKGKEVTERQIKNSTRLLLGIITSMALVLKNAGFVVSLNGAVMGSAIIYIFPSIIYLNALKKRLAEGTVQMKKRIWAEKMFNKLLIGFGIISATLGAAVTILDTFFPHILR